MVEDEVKHTRCTTCDADHEYKHARVPPQRRKREEALSVAEGVEAPPGRIVASEEGEPSPESLVAAPPDGFAPGDGVADADRDDTVPDAPDGETPRDEDEGPVHRRLIRATLPRPEGQLPERKPTEFTVWQPGGRGPRDQRDQRGQHAAGNANGNTDGRRRGRRRPQGQPGGLPRFGNQRQGGHSQGQPGNQRQGRRKRRR